MCETITKKFLGSTLQVSKLGLVNLKAILMSFNRLELDLLPWQILKQSILGFSFQNFELSFFY